MKNGKAWVCSKNTNFERVNNSCYMKMGYLCGAQPSLILDASQIGHFHGIMWEQHTLEVTDRGFLSKDSLAFLNHSSQLCLFQPFTNFLPSTGSISKYSIDLEIIALSWAFPLVGQSCQVAQHWVFMREKIICSSELNKVKSRWWLSIPYLLHQCALTVIPLWTIGVFQSKLLFQLDFDWRFSCWFVRIKVLVKTGDITFKMWLNEQGRT